MFLCINRNASPIINYLPRCSYHLLYNNHNIVTMSPLNWFPTSMVYLILTNAFHIDLWAAAIHKNQLRENKKTLSYLTSNSHSILPLLVGASTSRVIFTEFCWKIFPPQCIIHQFFNTPIFVAWFATQLPPFSYYNSLFWFKVKCKKLLM